MKKFTKASELMWLMGILLVALGVSICKKADLGVSMIAAPAFIVYEAVSLILPKFSVGMIEYLIQGVILIVLCIVTQRFNWKFLFAFLVAIIYGYVLDLWLLIFGIEPYSSLWLRYLMLFIGDIITATGVACFFRTYLPLQVYELFVSVFSDRYHIKISKVKLGFDLSCLFISLILALTLFNDVTTFNWAKIYQTSFHSIGLGTIITTFINTPIIELSGKGLNKLFDYNALFPNIEKLLKRNLKNNITEESINSNINEENINSNIEEKNNNSFNSNKN